MKTKGIKYSDRRLLRYVFSSRGLLTKWMIILAVALVTCTGPAAVRADNILPGAGITGPFSNITALKDQTYNKEENGYAISNDVGSSTQRLEIDLGALYYIKEVRIYWGTEGVAQNFSLWLSKTKADNEVLDHLDGTKGKKIGPATFCQTVDLQSMYARYLTLVFPPDAAVNKGKQVKIKEIEVIREESPGLVLKGIRYIAGDREINLGFATNIDAKSQIDYCEDTWEEKMQKPLRFIMPRTEHSGILYGLKPDTAYKIRIEVSSVDLATPVYSDYLYIRTKKEDFAYKRPAIGTFTQLPDDKFVNKEAPALDRLTDGSNDYFTSLALSGPIPAADQYFIIDLWQKRKLSEIVLYWWALAYPRSFDILVSPDNRNWEPVGEKLNAEDGILTTTGPPMRVTDLVLKDKEARYIKVLIPQGSPFFAKQSNWNFAALFEIKVF